MIDFCASLDTLPARDGSKDIRTASRTGDVKAIQEQLAAGADINSRTPIGNATPLVIAALHGRTAAAALLIEKGADLTIPDEEGSTPLLISSFFGHRDILKLLLEKGAEVNAKNKDGSTPLDTVSAEWGPVVEGVCRFFSALFQLELDLK